MQLLLLVPETIEEMEGPEHFFCPMCWTEFVVGQVTNDEVRAHADSLGHLVRSLIKDKLPREGDIPQNQTELRELLRKRKILMRREY